MKSLFLLMKHIFIFFLLVSSTSSLNATGPSWIYSQINPVSINAKGEVLCRTRYVENQMGGHGYMETFYGLCVLSKGKIIQFTTHTQDPKTVEGGEDKENDFFALQSVFDSIYNTPLDFDNLLSAERKICGEYGFTSNNVKSFKVGKIFKIADFEKNKKINLRKIRQKGLNNAKGDNNYSYDKICVAYDFGDILVINNSLNDDIEEENYGVVFDYYNPWYENGKKMNIGYDISDITGVLFLKQIKDEN